MEVKEFSELLYTLKTIDQKLVNIFEEKTGVSLTRFQIIKYLSEHPAATQKNIAECLRVDAAAITRHIKVLESEGYVVRRRNEKNNREIYVEITEFAKKKAKNCEENSNVREIIKEEFTDEDLQNLMQLLNKFSESLK